MAAEEDDNRTAALEAARGKELPTFGPLGNLQAATSHILGE